MNLNEKNTKATECMAILVTVRLVVDECSAQAGFSRRTRRPSKRTRMLPEEQKERDSMQAMNASVGLGRTLDNMKT